MKTYTITVEADDPKQGMTLGELDSFMARQNLITREEYLIARMMELGANPIRAREAVASTALAEGWDLTEQRPFAAWATEASDA